MLPQAIGNDKLAVLAGLVVLTCRDRGIMAPSPAALERLCSDLRHQMSTPEQRCIGAPEQNYITEEGYRTPCSIAVISEVGSPVCCWLEQHRQLGCQLVARYG